jgi:cytochrome c556
MPPLRVALGAVLAAFAAIGCDKAAERPVPSRESQTSPASASSPARIRQAAAKDASDAPIAVTVDASGRKWLTPKIPYDVFPDLPSEQELTANAAEQHAVSPSSAADPTAPSPEPKVVASVDRKPSDAMPEPAAAAESPPVSDATPHSDWEELLPRDTLLNEVAALRNAMGEGLLTVGSYNNAFEQVSNAGWEMSALATIAGEHPAAISWKPNALLARDTAMAIAMAATARGRENFKQAQVAKEQLLAVLNNNTPPGLPAPDPAASREETADRAALMTRMQKSLDALKSFTGDAAALKKGGATASTEAHVLAALAKFTSHKDYGGAENADYQQFAVTVIDGGLEMAKAAEADDAATFQSAFDRVGTACNNCHQKYRFEKN